MTSSVAWPIQRISLKAGTPKLAQRDANRCRSRWTWAGPPSAGLQAVEAILRTDQRVRHPGGRWADVRPWESRKDGLEPRRQDRNIPAPAALRAVLLAAHREVEIARTDVRPAQPADLVGAQAGVAREQDDCEGTRISEFRRLFDEDLTESSKSVARHRPGHTTTEFGCKR